MSLGESKQPIIVKKVIKKGGHHGGAWKIAFADFATAMMAFFLLLWIMGSTTKSQRAAISEYFRNPSAFSGAAVSPSASQGEGTGSKPSIIDFEGTIDMGPENPTPDIRNLDQDQIEKLAHEQDEARLEALEQLIKEKVEDSQTLAPYKDQLLIDIMPQGLRIQIVDKENRSMFDLGSAKLKSYTESILKELGSLINQVPNRISITGHTDARPLQDNGYTNWDLSTERANAARRALVAGGMNESKIGRIVGLASTVPFDKQDPNNPINRRISIIVMTQKTDEAIHARTTSLVHDPASPINTLTQPPASPPSPTATSRD